MTQLEHETPMLFNIFTHKTFIYNNSGIGQYDVTGTWYTHPTLITSTDISTQHLHKTFTKYRNGVSNTHHRFECTGANVDVSDIITCMKYTSTNMYNLTDEQLAYIESVQKVSKRDKSIISEHAPYLKD